MPGVGWASQRSFWAPGAPPLTHRQERELGSRLRIVQASPHPREAGASVTAQASSWGPREEGGQLWQRREVGWRGACTSFWPELQVTSCCRSRSGWGRVYFLPEELVKTHGEWGRALTI